MNLPDGTKRCDAEIHDREAMRDLPKGRLAWKGCPRKAVRTVTSRAHHEILLDYCQAHLVARGYGSAT